MTAVGLEVIVLVALVALGLAVFWRYRKQRVERAARPTPKRPASTTDSPEVRSSTGPRAADSTGIVFLSYASADRPAAQAIARALSRSGWQVWWDRTIPPGKSFDQVIESALDSAKCVIVLWSRESVSSDWVKTEAAEGARRRILVPALIDDVTIPLEFRRIQAASLVGWDASTSHPGFEALARSVADLVAPAEGRPQAH